jgi:uncharacterized membrane protein YgcG
MPILHTSLWRLPVHADDVVAAVGVPQSHMQLPCLALRLPPPYRIVAVLYEGYQPVDCGPESGPADQIRATTHKKAVMALGGAAAGKDTHQVTVTTGEGLRVQMVRLGVEDRGSGHNRREAGGGGGRWGGGGRGSSGVGDACPATACL